MTYNPGIHHRRSIRLSGYDYGQAGAYFVTICTFNRENLFGYVFDGEMRLFVAGELVAGEWTNTAGMRKNVQLDEWVVMLNHFHGILVIADDRDTAVDTGRGTARRAPTTEQFGRPVSGSVPTIVRSFKSAATRRINEWRKTPGAVLWQRNYNEHIIRDESEMNRIRDYIRNNPRRWEMDKWYVSSGLDGRGAAFPNEIREPSTGYETEVWMV